ncbi:MAG TPA: PQQ-binding-like beta-propeller repeat protein [Fimbriiglobus sp.]|jgi:outer membrane protein assembly factor BamB
MTRLLALVFAVLVVPLVRGDDWPQWMGPKRDNVWREDGIIDKFPESGAKKLWSAPVAGGYAGPAVAGGKVFVTDYQSAELTPEIRESGNWDFKELTGIERVLCLDEKSGHQLWKYEYPVKYKLSYPAGPRCTPNVVDGKVYTLGAEGHLACLDAATGKKVWSKELKQEYKTEAPIWGYAAHPLIDGKKLITLAGGDGSFVVALDKDTGTEIWKSQTQGKQDQGYSPPLLTEVNGVRELIVGSPTALRGLDPETGKRLWTTPFKADNGCVVMTPVRYGDYVFFGGFNNKSMLVKFAGGKGVEVVWKDKRGLGMSPIACQPVVKDGVLYAYDDSGKMYGVELPSGKRVWEGEGPVGKILPAGTAFIVPHGNSYIFFIETGHLAFGNLTPQGYVETSRAKVIDQTNGANGRKVTWCMPAFANKHCYVRNDKELVCIDLAK